jgi:cytochrome P450
MEEWEMNFTATTNRPLAPVDDSITMATLIADPYPIYRRLRAETPVARVAVVRRTMLTKARDTRWVKDNPGIFSSDDTNSPQRRALQAQSLSRKDGEEHRRERMSMATTFAPKTVKSEWLPAYKAIAQEIIAGLPRDETVDLFQSLASPIAARGLAEVLGIGSAAPDDMIRWCQAIMDGAGNFGFVPELFEVSDRANIEIDRCIAEHLERHRAERGPSALSAMVNAEDPLPMAQINCNIKVGIGGGLNEPRDGLLTAICGLLENPEQLDIVRGGEKWSAAFEEAIRWCAPIQASSRLVTEDTEIRGFLIPKGDTVMTIQASANHDEDVFANPERFDVTRLTNNHQSFGNGPHFCQGMHLARAIVSQVALPLLFERFPNMTIPDPSAVIWKGFGFRGPIQLPVRLN